MGWSPLSTEVHNTSQYSARSRAVAGVVLHHGATTSADAIIDMEVSGSRQVSSHQVVKDTRIAVIVQEEFRAWSLSDAYWDSWAFTVECANQSTDGWTISDASHESLAQLVANWATRYGFYPQRDGDPKNWTVYGHREIYTVWGGSYATACPGGMNLDWITKRAQDIINGTNKNGDEPMIRLIKEMAGQPPKPTGKDFVVGISGIRSHVLNTAHYNLLKRFIEDTDSHEQMYAVEMDIIASYLKVVNPIGASAGGGGGTAPTAAQNATAVKSALKEDFATVNKGIADTKASIPQKFTASK